MRDKILHGNVSVRVTLLRFLLFDPPHELTQQG